MDGNTLFYAVKGGVAVLATLLLIWHMADVRKEVTAGRWMRYLCLLYFSLLLSYASWEQIADGIDISPRNWGGMIGAFILLFTVGYSVRETRQERKKNAELEAVIRSMREG